MKSAALHTKYQLFPKKFFSTTAKRIHWYPSCKAFHRNIKVWLQWEQKLESGKGNKRDLVASWSKKKWLKRTRGKQENSPGCSELGGRRVAEAFRGRWGWIKWKQDTKSLRICSQFQWLTYKLLMWCSHLALLFQRQLSHPGKSDKNYNQFYLWLSLLHGEKYKPCCVASVTSFRIWNLKNTCLAPTMLKMSLKTGTVSTKKLPFRKKIQVKV